jgi:hypothetical protein
MKRRLPGVLSLLTVSAGLSGLGAAPLPVAPPAPTSWALPWGVANGAGRLGFATNATGGIDAFNLSTGKALWSSAEANKPLAVAADRLIAQAPEKANAVRIVALDVNSGKRLFRSDAVTFPDWVAVGLTHGRSFASQGRVEKGALWLRWSARAWYAGGARPTPEVERRARKNADGVARVDLTTGKVEMLAADKMPPLPKVKLPPGAEKVVSDKYAIATTSERVGREQRLVLKRWDLATGKALPPIELLSALALRVEVSADARTVLVHKAVASSALPPGDYAWWAFSTETGKLLSKFAYEQGTTTATALGGRAYLVVQVPGKGGPRPHRTIQRALKAIDLKTGKLAWERPIEPVRILLPLP